MNQLLLIESGQPSEMDKALLRLADWMGGRIKVLTNSSRIDLMEGLVCAAQNGQVGLAVGADTFAQMSELSEVLHTLAEFGGERSVPILVYGIDNSSSHIALLKSLGCRSIQGVRYVRKQPLRFRFSTDDPACLQQLAGLDFYDESNVGCDLFEITSSAGDEVVPLLFAEDHPVFIRARIGQGNIDLFLWTTKHIADVEAPASRGVGPEGMYQYLLPAIIYLKVCFGSSCWHNPNVRARLIVDDPLLHPRYGFLRYDALLDSMQRVSYGTTLAFIPWNYRRSQKQVTDLFQANKNLLSLCIHGCDHTNHEFDSEDEEYLAQIAYLAMKRMRMHQDRSGVLHEKVMVFPQGHFSSIALRALRTSGFVAAVNSTCYPSREETKLTLGDLMLPAVCSLHGFPIFLRRSATRILDIAVDLFVGKAGFVVAHHEFVQNGYGDWEQFAAQMNSLDERLSWDTLNETITKTYLQKVVCNSETHVRFFTPAFKWMNRLQHPVLVRLSKCDPEPSIIKEIRVNGQSTHFRAVEGYICFDAVVEGMASITVEILDKETQPVCPFKPSVNHQIRVGARRLLSEFRDNTLARHPTWLEFAKIIVRHLKLTGDFR